METLINRKIRLLNNEIPKSHLKPKTTLLIGSLFFRKQTMWSCNRKFQPAHNLVIWLVFPKRFAIVVYNTWTWLLPHCHLLSINLICLVCFSCNSVHLKNRFSFFLVEFLSAVCLPISLVLPLFSWSFFFFTLSVEYSKNYYKNIISVL